MRIFRRQTSSQIRPTFVLISLTLTILSSLVGCGSGGSSQSSQSSQHSATPVAVVSTAPVSGASSVAFNTSIAVIFNADINPATITPGTFQVSNVTGTVAYDATNKAVVFHPDAPMAANTPYTVVVTTGVKSTTGGALAQQYSFTFSTGNAPDLTPPTVTSVFPANGATSVPLQTAITVTFSEAMDPTGLVGNAGSGIPAALAYNSQTFTATLTPTSNLTPHTLYSATVPGTARDLAGNQMGADYVWAFTTAAQ